MSELRNPTTNTTSIISIFLSPPQLGIVPHCEARTQDKPDQLFPSKFL